jgi:Flp pilus assembly protein TadG
VSLRQHLVRPSRWKGLSGDDGSELIEMAIVLPIFLIIIMAIMDFGFLFQRYEVVNNAAREGARLAVVGTHTNAAVQTRVQNYLTSAGLNGSVTTQVGDTSLTAAGVTLTTKTVTVLYPSSFLFLPGTVNLQGVAVMRVETGS